MTRPPLDGAILVTGASSGIGAALARVLARRATSLVLVARRVDRLEALAAEIRASGARVVVHPMPTDLGDPAAREALLARVAREVGPIDVLINGAGFGDQGPFVRADWARHRQMIEVNAVAPLHLTRALLPGMVARGRGGVLNVSSAVGRLVLPQLATYTATKHFVTAHTQALGSELAGTGVVVSQLCPGPVATEFGRVARMRGGSAPPSFLSMSAERCAAIAVDAFARGRPMIVPGFWVSTGIALYELTPRPLRRGLERVVGGWLMRGDPSQG